MKVTYQHVNVVGPCMDCKRGEPRYVMTFKIGRYFIARLCPQCLTELAEQGGTEIAALMEWCSKMGVKP